MSIKLGIIREGKIDKRVPFTPQQAHEIMQRFPAVKVVCQQSSLRCYSDAEYAAHNIDVITNMHDCDILMGIKEVPVKELIAGKTYLFFSHTIKKQPYNRELLQMILKKEIRLIDYELLKDKQGNRLVAFGRYAGIVGAYNGLFTYGKRYNRYSLRRAYDCYDFDDLKQELKKVVLPPIKIVLTGGGRVGKGAMEVLEIAGIKKVSAADFLSKTFQEPVYTQLSSADYHVHKEGKVFDRNEFHKHPQHYKSDFVKFARQSELLIAGAYWNPQAPVLFTPEEMQQDNFKIKVIADISCDINGSIPATIRATNVQDPVYDYNPFLHRAEEPFSDDRFVTVMAIDNLPCELPRSASEDFGRDLIDYVMPSLLENDTDTIIARAVIAEGGKLTESFSYLQDYVDAVML